MQLYKKLSGDNFRRILVKNMHGQVRLNFISQLHFLFCLITRLCNCTRNCQEIISGAYQ